jgi:hypothetical protein
VLFLFGTVAAQLGFVVTWVRSEFPDCEAMILVGPEKWQRIRIEFEYESRNFLKHMHDAKECDLIVCWRHNWPECPVEVLELSAVMEELGRIGWTETRLPELPKLPKSPELEKQDLFARRLRGKAQIKNTHHGEIEESGDPVIARDRVIGDRKAGELRRMKPNGGSGGLAAQFRERAGGTNKMLKTQWDPPLQSRRRGYNDDPICGLETMTAVGNFFQDAIRAGSPKMRAVSNSFSGFQGEVRRRQVLRVMLHGLNTSLSDTIARSISDFQLVSY